MGNEDHPKSLWQRLTKQPKILLISYIVITLILIYRQWQTPALQSNVKSADTPIAINSCQWRPEPLQGTCDATKSTIESQLYDNAIDCEVCNIFTKIVNHNKGYFMIE